MKIIIFTPAINFIYTYLFANNKKSIMLKTIYVINIEILAKFVIIITFFRKKLFIKSIIVSPLEI